jgi:hypothetical protein
MISLVFLLAALPAQDRPDPTQQDLQQKRTEKLAKPVFPSFPYRALTL